LTQILQKPKVQIRFKRHSGQIEFHKSTARFRILSCGRRWGKTKIGAIEFLLTLLNLPERSVGYCVAPTFSHTQKQWKEILYYCPTELITDVNRSAHKITLIGEREIHFKSADGADSMRGEAVSILWMDEGGQIQEDRWTLELRPSLMDTKGKAIFTGTPKGKNWYFQLWTRGQDSTQSDYQSWAFSSYTNPYIDPKEIDEFKRDMPELSYRQEILAEFLDDIGSVFRRIRDCISGNLEEKQPNKSYVMGVDLAKHEDFTVIIILDQNGHLCNYDRFSKLDWVFQSKRIIDTAQQYNNARVLIDSTGVGDPIYDYLRRSHLSVEGYKFTNASKKDLIENLSIQIENKQVSYPDIPVLLSELSLYGYKISPAGVTSYNAPEGYHDDTVIALALACWQLKHDFKPWVVDLSW
jgi:hypothetical protein